MKTYTQEERDDAKYNNMKAMLNSNNLSLHKLDQSEKESAQDRMNELAAQIAALEKQYGLDPKATAVRIETAREATKLSQMENKKFPQKAETEQKELLEKKLRKVATNRFPEAKLENPGQEKQDKVEESTSGL